MSKLKKSVQSIVSDVLDLTIDKVASLVVSARDNRVEELTFNDLIVASKALQKECSGRVSATKCYIVFDKEKIVYRIGIFPVDSMMRTFGGRGNPVMETFAAERLDAKIASMMRNGSGKFTIPNN